MSTPNINNENTLNAQNKTISVLKKKVYELYNTGNKSKMHIALEKARKHAEEAKQKRAVIEREYKILEEVVSQRTKLLSQKTNDLTCILHNMQQGILMITQGGVIHPEYSLHLETILETDQIPHANFNQVILEKSLIDSDHKQQILAAIYSMLGEDEFNYHANCHLFPDEFTITVNERNKILSSDWGIILSEDKKIEKVLLCLKDITEIKALKVNSEKQANELKVISQILSISPREFELFISRSESLINESKKIINNRILDPESIRTIFINIHTIKGNSRTLGFSAIANVAHNIEEAYHKYIGQFDCQDEITKMNKHLDSLSSTIKEYYDLYINKINRSEKNNSLDYKNPLLINAKIAIDHIITHYNNEKLNTDLITVKKFFDTIDSISLEGCIEDLSSYLPDLAKRLNKSCPNLNIDNNSVSLPIDHIFLIHDCFTHIMRNSLDHGIESESIRKQKRLPITGTINIIGNYYPEKKVSIIEIWDDGQGLALKKIRQICTEKSLVENEKELSDIKISQYIFTSGFTTATSISEISGRGVGMDAIKKFIGILGGNVKIKFINNDEGAQYRKFKLILKIPQK